MITANILHCAQIGVINLDAIETHDDVATGAKYSSHFREAIRGLDANVVWASIEAAKAKGKRTFAGE
jgi:hypothetical protein